VTASALMTPAQAAAVLDDVLTDRIMGIIDMAAIASFECDLFCALRSCGMSHDDAAATSAKLIIAAFRRAGEELYEQLGAGLVPDLEAGH
jgi:hypothetical protein